MDARSSLEAKPPGRHVTQGAERAPYRSCRCAMGLARRQIDQPVVGVVVTGAAVENAAVAVSDSRGSTKVARHPPAIAHECSVRLDLFDVAQVLKRTPYVADLKPGGRYVAKEMLEAGGVPLLVRTQLDHGYLHVECSTVTGRTVAESLGRVKRSRDQDVVHPADKPLSATGGVVGLQGNLAPIVEVAGMADLKFSGPARCFDGEEACFVAVKKKKCREGDVLVIRHEGPEGAPGMREMLATTAALYVGPEAASDGPIALVRDGHLITIHAVKGRLEVGPARAEIAARAKSREPRAADFTSGDSWKYAQQVGPPRPDPVTDPGGAAEKKCHADI